MNLEQLDSSADHPSLSHGLSSGDKASVVVVVAIVVVEASVVVVLASVVVVAADVVLSLGSVDPADVEASSVSEFAADSVVLDTPSRPARAESVEVVGSVVSPLILLATVERVSRLSAGVLWLRGSKPSSSLSGATELPLGLLSLVLSCALF